MPPLHTDPEKAMPLSRPLFRCACGLALTLASAAGAQVSSVYTALSGESCRMVRLDEETASSTQRCPGARGFSVLVHDDDARMSLDVQPPAGQAQALDFWQVVTHGFSSLGPRVEWRIVGRRVSALIVRLNASEDPERPTVTTSYLVVAKPVRGRWCVTDRIAPSADANARARRAADAPGGRCRTEPS
jgi:hypothetical protein